MDGECLKNYLQIVLNEKKSILKFNGELIKNYDAGSNKGCILEVDVEYPKNLLSLHNDLPFLAERKKNKKCNKLVCNIHDKENHVVQIKVLKQAVHHRLILKKVHRVIEFNQEAWLNHILT